MHPRIPRPSIKQVGLNALAWWKTKERFTPDELANTEVQQSLCAQKIAWVNRLTVCSCAEQQAAVGMRSPHPRRMHANCVILQTSWTLFHVLSHQRAHLSPASRQSQSVCRYASFAACAPGSLAATAGLTSSMNTSHSSYCHQPYSA